jgi:integrase/recombinase XerD
MEVEYLFWLRKNQMNLKGEAKIYCRVFDNSKRVNFSTGESVNPKHWKNELKRVSSKNPRYKIINESLDRIERKIRKIIYRFEDEGKIVTPEMVKSEFDGSARIKKPITELFKQYIQHHQILSTKSTLKNYEYTLQRINQFAKDKYGRSNIYASEINLRLMSDFEYYLGNTQKLQPISINKHTQRLKTVMKFAARMEILPYNPVSSHARLKEQKKEIIFLSEDELHSIENKKLKMKRLDRIRDLFVFSCYTGLAYKEISDLDKSNLIKGLDGNLWLSYVRHKTLNSKGISIKIPLLSKALAIIQKYSIDPEVIVKNRLLPVPSNQKFNAYLKEIADLCEIDKELTTHVARKTFATTVTLANDVPIETVSQALGHTDIKITQQYYAKVVPQKMMRDMQKLEKKLSSKKKGKKKKKSS